jgi:TetR/AcrR family transcriptional repressor of lmrAB and yxaGH operons
MIETAGRLLRQHGYHATSWRHLVDEAGTPWGSAHHHFPGGKEQLGIAAIELGARAVVERIGLLLAKHETIPRAVKAWCKASAADLEQSDFRDGCPIATVALETSGDSAALSAACREAFDLWKTCIAGELVKAGVRRKRASELATIVLVNVEGALLVARASRSVAPLSLTGELLEPLLQAEIELARSA